MRDRMPTNVLGNGAIRYAVYDEQGGFLRYEYILPADAPIDEGTPLNKVNLLSDVTAAILGLSGDPTVNDALANLGAKAQISQNGIEQLTTAKGNCEIYTGSYAGNGNDTVTLTFPKPVKFIAWGAAKPSYGSGEDNYSSPVVDGVTISITDIYKHGLMSATGSGNSVVLHGQYNQAGWGVNGQNYTYYYVAFASAT